MLCALLPAGNLWVKKVIKNIFSYLGTHFLFDPFWQGDQGDKMTLDDWVTENTLFLFGLDESMIFSYLASLPYLALSAIIWNPVKFDIWVYPEIR